MKRLVGSLTASWRNLASSLRHCTRSFIVTSWEMHFPRHFRPVLTTKSLRFGAYILRASFAVQFAPSRNFTRCRSAVLEVARFQSESFDCCLRKPAPRFDLLIRSHHCTDNCFGLLRILFGHEVDRADGRTAP